MNDKSNDSDDILSGIRPRPDRKVEEPERMMASVPCDELLRMLGFLNDAEFPKVTFSSSMKDMASEAFRLREESLRQLRFLIEKHTKFL